MLGFRRGGCDEAGVEDQCDRKSMHGFRGGGCDEELMKPAPAWIPNLGAWIPNLGFRGLNSVEVDARKPPFDVTKIRSLDSEAWIPDAAKRLMWQCCQQCGKCTNLERENARQLERNSLKYFFIPLTLRISWICVVSTAGNFVQPRSIMEIGTPPIGRRTPPIGLRLDVAADWTLGRTSDPKIRVEDS